MKNEEQIIIEEMIKDPVVRRRVTPQSFRWFFPVYFPHYLQYGTADFQKELFAIAEDDSIKLAAITAFRSSSKSTVLSMAYPIWSIIGRQAMKFVVLLADSQEQARTLLSNIRSELEDNEPLRSEMGPFAYDERWGATSLVIPKYGARITAASVQQKVRGLRHHEHRPDLIILDDVEDSISVRNLEQRDKIYSWFSKEVIPLGDLGSRIIALGNLVHEDCLLERLSKQINAHDRPGIARKFPIIDDDGKILWPSKFPTLQAIEDFRKHLHNEEAWHQEYLLKPFNAQNRVIKREWLSWYEEQRPPTYPDFRCTLTGIDPAYSERDKADYTAMVSADIYGYGDNIHIVVRPHPVNEHLDFVQLIARAKEVSRRVGNGKMTELLVEEVAAQTWAFQQLKKVDGYPAKGIKIGSLDKRSRLAGYSGLIESGRVVFPQTGAELLIAQLCDFGIEPHDDLVDALTIVLTEATTLPRYKPGRIVGNSKAAWYNRA